MKGSTAASNPPPKIWLTAHWRTGESPTYQWLSADGDEVSPVLTDYKEALQYPKTHEPLKKIN